MEQEVQLFTRGGTFAGTAHVRMPDGHWPPAITVFNKTYVLQMGRYVETVVREARPNERAVV